MQVKHPTRGDWASTCMDNMKQLKITESLQEIRNMKTNTFEKLVKTRIDEIALFYLTNKQGIKGGEISYSYIEMSEYLTPTVEMNISEKRYMFSVKNWVQICHQLSKKEMWDGRRHGAYITVQIIKQ